MICNTSNTFLRKRSFERFKYRKEIEIKDEKLKSISQAYSEGIAIFSYAKELLFFNDKIFSLLNCTEQQLITTLSKVEYCIGKKLTSLSETNMLIDDINGLITSDITDAVVLGVSLDEEISLE